LVEPFQSVYSKHHSPKSALLKIFDNILQTVDSKQATALLLLDISAAIDTVNHKLLLNRLSQMFGICGSALNWFQS